MDPRQEDKTALLEYIEHTIKNHIDEMLDLGACDEVWRVWDYLWDRLPIRPDHEPVVTAQGGTTEP